MPQYFFHVLLELLTNPRNPPEPLVLQAQQRSSPFEKALEPFQPVKRRKTSKTASLHTQQSRDTVKPSRKSVHEDRTQVQRFIASRSDDIRLDDIFIEGTNMTSPNGDAFPQREDTVKESQINKGIGTSTSGLQTKGRFVPIEQDPTSPSWGIVHLYRDVDETSGLYTKKPPALWNDGIQPKKSEGKPYPPPKDEECTTLCILAVPSYLAPADFLAFVGEETRSEVSHFRMILTSRANRYMVLMKFRNGKKARDWQFEWNGKVFNSMEPETCHVVFLKSVEVIHSSADPSTQPTALEATESPYTTTYPSIAPDPFATSNNATVAVAPATASSKPFPPPTPSLLELPTCPVCLERMDETTGLLTVLCQHVFHCTCLQKWSGGGCPVCRYTHDDFSTTRGAMGPSKKSKTKYKTKNALTGEFEPYYDEDDDGRLECEDCHSDLNLWQCLICGRVGCGRYEGKHAFKHGQESGHSFAMDLESKRVWDYGGDGYVHRILQDPEGHEEKSRGESRVVQREDWEMHGDGDDSQGKESRESLALEYTHLLTSQLESQRVYFEGIVERAVDKASQASRDAERALEDSKMSRRELEGIRAKFDEAQAEQVPALEREKVRLEKRAKKFEELSREVRKQVDEEREVNRNLMERVTFLNTQVAGLTAEKGELEEMVRDLTFSISASEKLKEMEEDGKEKGLLATGELQEGTLEVPEEGKKGGGKGKKGKGRR